MKLSEITTAEGAVDKLRLLLYRVFRRHPEDWFSTAQVEALRQTGYEGPEVAWIFRLQEELLYDAGDEDDDMSDPDWIYPGDIAGHILDCAVMADVIKTPDPYMTDLENELTK